MGGPNNNWPTPPVTANNPTPVNFDRFGESVAVSGTTVVVGALADDTGASNAGSAYVYDVSGGSATLVDTINNPTPAFSDGFGLSVAVSGSTVVVGAYQDDTGAENAGSAYVYDLSGGSATLVDTINNPTPATNDFFGLSVAASGSKAVIGAFLDDDRGLDAGAAYVFAVTEVPIVDLNGSSSGNDFVVGFTENVGPVFISDSTATVTDADSTDIVSMNMVVSANPDGIDETVSVGGVPFPLDADKSSTTVVGSTTFRIDYVTSTLTFDITQDSGGSAPITDWQSLLRSVTYDNSSDTPNTTARTVDITVNDGISDSEVATSTINVTPTNDPPVLTAIGNQSIDELTTLNFTASATDPDNASIDLTFSLDAGAPSGATIDPSTGLFSWTPTEADGPGSYSVTIRVTDDGSPNLDDSETFSITVNEVNSAPTLNSIDDQGVEEGMELTFIAAATDPDEPAGPLTFSLDTGAPTGAAIDPSTGLFSWTPTEADGPGSYSVTIRVTDDGSPILDDSQTISITVSEVNSAPVLDSIGNQAVDEGMELNFTASASDADDPANTLTFSLDTGAPSGATINPTTGEFSWTPSESDGGGLFPVTVRVTDDGLPPLDAFEVIQISVGNDNQAPELDPIGDKTVDELSELTFTVTASDADVPPDGLTFSLDAGAPAGASIDPSTGLFSWTPTEADGPGSYPVTIRVTDDGSPNLNDSETIDITVNEVNSAPTLSLIENQTVDVGDDVTFTATATDTDLRANMLSYSLGEGAPIDATFDPLTGEFVWTPGVAGEYDIEVIVSDDGTPPLEDSQIVTISVNEVAPEQPVFYLSSNTNGVVGAGSIAFRDEDILAYDPANDAWSLFFDGSAAGLGTTDVNAFHVRDDGSILMSIDNNLSLPGIGTVEDSDIVLFDPVSNSFGLWFDGSSVGLTTGGEDIDAIGVTPDGDLLISTIGVANVVGATGVDDSDILLFNATSLGVGSPTAGSFEIFFNASDLGLTSRNEDVNALHADPFGTLLFSTIGNLRTSTQNGDNDDVFTFIGATGENTSGTLGKLFNGDDVGFGAENIDGMTVVMLTGEPPENEAPEITSPASVNVLENQTFAIDVQAIDDLDLEGSGLTFAFSSTGIGAGIDNALFDLGSTGEVTFIDAPDHEAPADADGNNIYNVEVTVSDSGGLSATQAITITVDDVTGELPEISVINEGNELSDGDSVTFAPTVAGGPGTPETFTVRNDGFADLILQPADV